MEELISVIVPIYNVDAYLRKAIKSILNQTYQNLEVILVDDGSTDQSCEICKRFCERDQRIQLICQENQGVAGARNTGLKNAHGAYIGFVDPDDAIHPQMYEILYNNLMAAKSDISVGMYCTYTDFEFDSDIDLHQTNKTRVLTSRESLLALYGSTPPYNSGILCDKLFKRELFHGLSFNDGKIHEDEMIIYRVFDQAKSIVYSEYVMYYYYKREGSIMQRYTLQRLDALAAYKERIEYFKNRGYKELYEKSIQRYLYVIRLNYFAVKTHFPDRQDLLHKLMDEHKTTRIGFKISFFPAKLFETSPFLYRVMNKILRMITQNKYIWE